MGFVFDIQLIAHYATWMVASIFFLALVPQMLLNYRLKSTAGLSDSMLLMYFTAYAFEVGYVYMLNLPLSYRVMMPCGFIAVIVMVMQRLYYAPSYGSKRFINLLYYITGTIGIIIGVGFYDHIMAGRLAGWVAMGGFALAYVPQLIRVHTTKSVHGLSLLFIFMLGMACTVEFIVSLYLGLPIPSLANGFRGMLFNIIFLVQFWMYKKPFVIAEDSILEETQLQ